MEESQPFNPAGEMGASFPFPSRARAIANYVRRLRIHTEPIIFLTSLANGLRNVLSPHLSEVKMRRVYTPPSGLSPKELKVFFNKKMVLWDQNFVYVSLPILCFAGILWGAYSDRRGRRLPIVLGILSNVLDNLMRALIWWEVTDLPLQWFFADAVVYGALGGAGMVLVNAYIVDKHKERNALSARMVLFSALFSAGSLSGAQIAEHSIGLLQISHISLMFTSVVILASTIPLCYWLLDNQPPVQQINEVDGVDGEEENGGSLSSLREMVVHATHSFMESFRIFTVERVGSCRLFICTCFFVNFLDTMIFNEESVLIGIYTRLSPFYWDTAQLGIYKSIRPITQLAGMLFGVVILKGVLKLRDTSIIVLSILSMGSDALVIGMAESSFMIYLSLLPGSLHGLLTPLAYTFLSFLVLPDEVGKVFAITTIASKGATFIQSLVLQNVYVWTVEWFQPFIWCLLAGLSGVSAALYTMIAVRAKRENIGQ